MSVEVLQKLSMFCFIMAGILLVSSVWLFFRLDVRKLIGDVTGFNAKKAIAKIRKQNEAGNDSFKLSRANRPRERVTDKMSPSGRIEKIADHMVESVGTERLVAPLKMVTADETTVLTQEPEITIFALERELCFLGSKELIR